jgi:Ni,Fe-hydrogenase III small subunit
MRKTLIENLFRGKLTEPLAPAEDAEIAGLVSTLGHTAHQRLGRSLAIRALDAGSCNGCELEMVALANPYYDLERFGLKFVASPRHADVLMITGPVTRAMRDALCLTHEAMPAPKFVVAVGDCACSGGLFANSPACIGAVEQVIAVDLRIPGCPPDPRTLLQALIGFAGKLGSGA